MSRITVAARAAACAVVVTSAVVVASAAAATSAAAAQSAKPKPSPSAKRSTKPAAPAIPVPVPSAPRPSRNCPSPGGTSAHVTGTPWAQQALDFSSVWDLSEGLGITVAVVDSGVDYSPQLAGRVDAIDLTKTGAEDCVGHGTAVASIIAASDLRARGVPFTGVAPEARILSVKVTNNANSFPTSLLAAGIEDATIRGASVINVSAQDGNSSQLHAAVDFALRRNVVVVAAGGNDRQESNGTIIKGPFYPASYPGVLSVGAVERDGALAQFSDRLSHVAVTAPGWDVTAAVPRGYAKLTGTSFSTAFVAGVAALVRARFPSMSAAQVVRRIEATADGTTGPGTGNGLVNPLQAVTAIMPSLPASTAPSARPQPVPVFRAPAADRAARITALTITAGSLAAAVLVTVGALVLSRGRRRRWRAARAQLPADGDPDESVPPPAADAGLIGG
jgi:membrane-anchored mycosin MYCP